MTSCSDPRRDPRALHASSSRRTPVPTAIRSARRWRWPRRSARLGKSVRMVNRDRPPSAVPRRCPASTGIEVAPTRSTGDFDALVVLECSDLSRPGVAGLEGYFTINIDHHPGNADVRRDQLVRRQRGGVRRAGRRRDRRARRAVDAEIAIGLYLAILTDTGGRSATATSPRRTFEIVPPRAEAGVDAGGARPAGLRAEQRRQAEADWRAPRRDGGDRRRHGSRSSPLDDALLARTGATAEDTDGLINMPLMAAGIQAVVLVRGEAERRRPRQPALEGRLDVRLVAAEFGGGGHTQRVGLHRAAATRRWSARDVVDRLTRVLAERARPGAWLATPSPAAGTPVADLSTV